MWWISVGRNDLINTQCSEEVALIGVIRVVEELVAKNDGATIVINSILPTATKTTLQLDGRLAHNDMWKSINEVNVRLKRFAQKHHHVLFFDADEVFVETRREKKYITKLLYSDKEYPSLEGYKQLADTQLQFIDSLMQKRADSQSVTGTGSTTTGATDENAIGVIPGSNPKDFTNYDDYYGYESLFEQNDDLLGDINLYGDDSLDDDFRDSMNTFW